MSTRKTFDDESIFALKLMLDSLTRASPNGVTPTNEVQTFIWAINRSFLSTASTAG
ncbi:hypothetical protein [Psychromonas hadalis]|uniref:hypothetical protein n=1 Tax=Psychromonas hadalis TaxID=211669 RepID=UPI0003B3A819|nr:hypothetical protein [Psychromonas hadalis]